AADPRQGRYRAGEGEGHRQATQGLEDESSVEHPGNRGARRERKKGRSPGCDCAGAQVGHRYSAPVPEFPGLTTPPASPAPLLDEEGKFFSNPRSFLPPAQRADDDDLVVRGERGTEVGRLLLVDEDPDVAPDRILLVDHAEADPRIAPLEVREQRGERR